MGVEEEADALVGELGRARLDGAGLDVDADAASRGFSCCAGALRLRLDWVTGAGVSWTAGAGFSWVAGAGVFRAAGAGIS